MALSVDVDVVILSALAIVMHMRDDRVNHRFSVERTAITRAIGTRLVPVKPGLS